MASRRGADLLIADGRVTVNGTRVTELGSQADADEDAIRVDGKRIPGPPRERTYVMLHKPKAYVTTASDPEGRPTVLDLVPPKPRLFSIGRLDYHSEGLLLLTDDGDLARDVMDPKTHLPKVYHVKVRGRPDDDTLERFRKGLPLDGRRTRPAEARVLNRAQHSWIEVVLTEGRKRQIRRMFQILGHPVQKLKRVQLGPLLLGDLPTGGTRMLSPREVERLRAAVRKPLRRRPNRA